MATNRKENDEAWIDEVADAVEKDNRDLRTVLKEKLFMVKNERRKRKDESAIATQREGILRMVEQCKAIPEVQHDDNINPSTDYKKVIYGKLD